MNIPLVIACVLSGLAFFVHTIVGDKDFKVLEGDGDQWREKWTQGRAGWHMVSFDLLFATVLLGLISFTEFIEYPKQLLTILMIYFFGYASFWFITILCSKKFPMRFIKLGQWILLLLIGTLILFARN